MGRKLRSGMRGQSVVEMALVLPILLLLLLGMAEFARLFSNYLTLQQAAREGVRLAITGAADSSVTSRITNMASGLNTSKLTILITPAAPRASGTDVTISLQYPVTLMTPLVAQVVGGTITLQTQIVARME